MDFQWIWLISFRFASCHRLDMAETCSYQATMAPRKAKRLACALVFNGFQWLFRGFQPLSLPETLDEPRPQAYRGLRARGT